MGIPLKLFRSTNFKYAKVLVEEGEILFRPLSYYRSIEDAKRQDSSEGIFTREFDKGTIEIVDEATQSIKRKIPLLKASIDFTTSRAGEIFVLCFSLDPNVNFGDARVEVFDPLLFLASLKGFLKKAGIELYCGPVEYYDRKNIDISYAWKKIGFLKSNIFKNEAEFRLAFLLNEDHEFNSRILTTSLKERYFTFSSTDFAKYIKIMI
jgi:hypothetical protein